MTPLPGPPPGNAPPRARPCTPAHHRIPRAARVLLATLLLTVLAVTGSVPTALGSALPARPSAGVPSSVAYAPGGHRPTPHTDRTTHTTRSGAGNGAGAGAAQDTRRVRTAAAADHTHRPQTGPAPQPRAGSDQVRTAHHLPPPGLDALLPRTPGSGPWFRAHHQAPAEPPRAVGRLRVALPGVRGPPRKAAHRPPVLPPVPFHSTAVQPPPR
ncbi:hypothetical protein ACFVWY_23860 [Streptomyces sp. NPDC058195]|uniref:hypothetical protein n=1 Tax=Streptomyces sp. NPDC058195 TaxID=3346375 RepID=UPI0036E3D1D3